MLKTLIINGSSRKDGDSEAYLNELKAFLPAGVKVYDLVDWDFSHYDYDHLNREDDFLKHIREMVRDYDLWIFVTPVYWYAMSGLMKQFFDRMTDCITIEKETGRKLRGKRMGVVSISNGNNLGSAFWLPFEKTAVYLGMHFEGGYHIVNGQYSVDSFQRFVREKLNTSHSDF